ncbi:hypothetical protein FXO38_31909 [Capsicum annuum]|nr:hypothetical protein FXO38_31909 [Capsicum annuum]KAF3624235.1 hypothetical protein FXO37_31459 [Capsicum annuum]
MAAQSTGKPPYGHDEEGCRVLHAEHIPIEKEQEDGDSFEQTDQHAAAGHIVQVTEKNQAITGANPNRGSGQPVMNGKNSNAPRKELEVRKGPGAPLQTSNKYTALENGDGENNQLDEVPHKIVAAEGVHTTNAGNVDKNLNANAPVFKPRNTTGSPAKEKSTKEWVTSAFAKENGGQLVTTNQSYQEIPPQTYETTTKEGDKEIEEGEVHDRNVDEHGDDQNQINSQVQVVDTNHKMLQAAALVSGETVKKPEIISKEDAGAKPIVQQDDIIVSTNAAGHENEKEEEMTDFNNVAEVLPDAPDCEDPQFAKRSARTGDEDNEFTGIDRDEESTAQNFQNIAREGDLSPRKIEKGKSGGKERKNQRDSSVPTSEPFQHAHKIEKYRRRLGMPTALSNINGKIWAFMDENWEVTVLMDTEQQLSLKLFNNELGKQIIITLVYAKCDSVEWVGLWDSMHLLGSGMSDPWIIAGDFNVIVDEEEKYGGLPVSISEVEDFRYCIQTCNLSDLGFKGIIFKWWNGRTDEACIFKRLDRCLGNLDVSGMRCDSFDLIWLGSLSVIS